MKSKKIEILEEILQPLHQKTFDLDAWKIRSILVVKKIFGENDPKIALIEGLRYNYSSWALRDHSGGVVHDPVKDKAKEIIETALIELKLESSEPPVLACFDNELTGSEMKILNQILDKKERSPAEIKEFLEKLPPGKAVEILTQIILGQYK